MTKLFISDLNSKDEVESIFLVKFMATQEGKDGRRYFNLILTDSTGDMESRLWQYSEELEKTIAKNTFVKVRGKVNFYQGRKQFIISHLEKIDSSQVNQDDFVMKSVQDPEKMYSELLKNIEKLTDVYIRDLLKLIVSEPEIARRLKTWQAGKSIHHAYKSGLIEHILSCTELALHLSKHYKVNENYVVAGCILHDLCKVYELTDGVNVEYTEEGKLVGHLVKGVEIVDRFTYKIKNFPHQMKLHLKHILLSHHGEYEYGSPKIPQTSEAMLVHLIDLMDSKMASFDIVKKTDNATGHWSGFVKHLDRIIFKAELPFYPEYVSDDEHESHDSKTKHQGAPKTSAPKTQDPKTSLGKMLAGYKSED